MHGFQASSDSVMYQLCHQGHPRSLSTAGVKCHYQFSPGGKAGIMYCTHDALTVTFHKRTQRGTDKLHDTRILGEGGDERQQT